MFVLLALLQGKEGERCLRLFKKGRTRRISVNQVCLKENVLVLQDPRTTTKCSSFLRKKKPTGEGT